MAEARRGGQPGGNLASNVAARRPLGWVRRDWRPAFPKDVRGDSPMAEHETETHVARPADVATYTESPRLKNVNVEEPVATHWPSCGFSLAGPTP